VTRGNEFGRIKWMWMGFGWKGGRREATKEDVEGREEGRTEDAEGRKTGKHGHTPHLPEWSGCGCGVD
jgi:hypothetical protein